MMFLMGGYVLINTGNKVLRTKLNKFLVTQLKEQQLF